MRVSPLSLPPTWIPIRINNTYLLTFYMKGAYSFDLHYTYLRTLAYLLLTSTYVESQSSQSEARRRTNRTNMREQQQHNKLAMSRILFFESSSVHPLFLPFWLPITRLEAYHIQNNHDTQSYRYQFAVGRSLPCGP